MLRALVTDRFAGLRAGLPAAGLLLVLAALVPPTPAQARDQVQARQQAALAVPEAPPATQADRAIIHYNRVRPHGPLGDVGRGEMGRGETGHTAAELRALLLRGMSHHRLGDADRALADYDEILRREPGHAVAHLNRGIVLSTHKDEPGKAIADFDRVLVLTPDGVDALVFRGDAHTRLGDYRKALADLDRAVSLAPDHAQTRVLRGLARALLGQRTQAAADYGKALSLYRRNVDALVNRAAILSGDGDHAGAIRDLDTAVVIEPGNALAHYNRGHARFVRGEHDKALADYSAAIRLDPRLGWAYLNRCLTRAVAGRETGQAAADCERAQRLLPGNPRVLATQAFVQRKLGDLRPAREFASRVSN
ncbi:MAG: tetratricopeptide repeat protein [Alphaproteobacteria bacterium]|jgi:tetratricopeptide (TPR) repeat protein